MAIIELDNFSSEQWAELSAGEQQPWGAGPAESMIWADKQRYVAALAEDGRPAGVVGIMTSEVEAGGQRFPVAGVGSLMVTAALRRQGLGGKLLERILELAAAMGPEHAMLFCKRSLVERYARAGFIEIEAPVFADQPEGRTEVPLEAMWRPLRDGAGWPAGRVDVLGLPF
jgi:GNAT superfamily N-acetyltransferase